MAGATVVATASASASASAKAKAKARARANTGVLRFAQDDGLGGRRGLGGWRGGGRLVGDEGLQVAGDFGAGPVLGGDEFAAEDALLVDDVALGYLAGAVEGLDVGGGITEGEEVDVVLLEEAVVLVGVLVLANG